MVHSRNIRMYVYSMIVVLTFAACNKVDIDFGESSSETDPDVTYLDNYKTDIATYKVDSFVTSGHDIFSIGYHSDPVFGSVKAGAYVELTLPSANPVKDRQVIFDSLELILKPSGQFYGDSSLPIKINVFRLAQNIKRSDGTDTYYNNTVFSHDAALIADQQVDLNNRSGTDIHIRLSDALGQELLSKFQANSNEVQSDENFIDYLKGFYITSDSMVTNTLAYFNKSSDTSFVRLHYKENYLFPESKYLDFSYTSEKQFNNISNHHTNPDLAAFQYNQAQLIESSASNHRSFLQSSLGQSIRITFPTLFDLKELHPYIKIVNATLIVRPATGTFMSPHSLPPLLLLYRTDASNALLSIANTLTTDGSLLRDDLYGVDNYYSFNITSFINDKLNEGTFSQSALMLSPSFTTGDEGLDRLVVNDQTSTNSVQLKLYVLGL